MAQRSTNRSNEDYEYNYKIMLIGDRNSGKSALLHKFTRDFIDPAPMVVISTRTISLDNQRLRVDFWDTCTSKRYKPMIQSYYRGAAGAMVVYDTAHRDTFDNIDRRLSGLRENADADLSIMLVGNNSGSKYRTVSEEEAAQYASQNSLLFYEISSLSSDDVEEAFVHFIAYIYWKRSQPV